MEPLLKGKRFNSSEGVSMPLQVMSPNGPSAPRAPGLPEVGGEHVQGHQDLIPATQGSGTVQWIASPHPEGKGLCCKRLRAFRD